MSALVQAVCHIGRQVDKLDVCNATTWKSLSDGIQATQDLVMDATDITEELREDLLVSLNSYREFLTYSKPEGAVA